MKVTKFKCAICGLITTGRMPRDSGGRPGDTTSRYPRRHTHLGSSCPGSVYEAIWVDVEKSKSKSATIPACADEVGV